MENRVTKISLEILSMSKKVKPLPLAKRIVINKYKLTGTYIDKICTSIVNDIERWYGPIIYIINSLGIERNEIMILFTYFVFIRRESISKIKKRFENIIDDNSIQSNYYEIISFEPRINNIEERLFWNYAFPKIYFKNLVKYLDETFIESLAKSFFKKPKFSIRVNTRKITTDKLINIMMKKYNINFKKSKYSKVCILSDKYINIEKCKEYKHGYFTIQDEISSVVPLVLDIENKNLKILDMCAAPGIKTTEMSELSPGSKIYAIDISLKRLKSLEFHMKRLDCKNISFFHMDARSASKYFTNVDRILMDVPCSSSGTVIRNPSVKWQINNDTIKRLKKLQIEIFEEALNCVKNGGVLVYSTCSLFVEENEKIIEYFLDKGEIELLKINFDLFTGIYKKEDIDNFVCRSFTNIHNTSCFFIAKLLKI